MGMDSLRIENGIKKIEVNDDGEYIQFSVTDSSMFKAFADFLKWIESEEASMQMQEIGKKANDIKNEDGELNTEAFDNVVSAYDAFIKKACTKIDAIFGADACRKIFCGVTPDFYAITDFLEKITPFLDKYAKERHENINLKYSARRRGAKS